jgi:hypothetical protein
MLIIKALGIFTVFFLIVYNGSALGGRYDEKVSRVFISLFWGLMSSLGFVLVETVL